MKQKKSGNHLNLIAGLVAIVVAAFIPFLLPSPYYLDLIIKTVIFAVLAMTFILTLRSGLVNMGLTAFWGIGAYVSSVLVMKLNLSFWLSLPLSTIITGIVSLGIGFILIGSGSTGFTFVILSSVLGMLFSVVVGNIEAVGGHDGLSNIPQPNPINIPFLPAITFNSKIEFFYLALVLLIIIILVLKTFYSSRIGRAWNAIGLNLKLAESVGVDLFRYKMLSFVMSSCICGLIGAFYAHYNGFIIPSSFGMWQGINIQLYAIMGGIGFATIGPLLGSAVIIFVPELLRVANLIAPIITGVILILLILFFPSGLLGLLQWRTAVMRAIKRVYTYLNPSQLLRREDKK
jgi:branched-chain amino acid transport system permease protein